MFSAINSIDPDGYPTFSDATELRQLVEWLPMGKEGIDYLQYKSELFDQNSALLKTALKGIVKKPMLIVDALRLKAFHTNLQLKTTNLPMNVFSELY